VRRQVVGPDPLGLADRVQLAQPGRDIDQRPAVADQQPGLHLGKGLLRLADHGRQERRDDHLRRVEPRPQHGHHVRDVPVLLELDVQLDPARARAQHLGEQRRADAGRESDVVAGQSAHRRAAHGRVVERDQLTVAGPADVELDHVGADVDGVGEGRDGVLGRPRRDPAVRGDHGTDHAGSMHCPGGPSLRRPEAPH